MITSRSDFKGDILIANADDIAPFSNLIGNAAYLDDAIERYERECLTILFGIEMYNEFMLQFDQTVTPWVLLPDSEQKWKDLLNGATYDNCHFEGVKKAIPYYIYAKFIEEDELRHTGVGFVKDDANNARIQSGRSKWAYAYNTFVQKAYGCNRFLNHHKVINLATYPYWRHRRFEYVNRFGL